MSLTQKEIIALKKEVEKKCNITTKQKQAMRLYLGFDGETNRSFNDIRKIMKLTNVKITDAIVFPMIKLRRFFEKNDYSEEDVERVIHEIFK